MKPQAAISERAYVLFDYDGTLANTAPTIMKLARQALLAFGFAEEELGDLTRIVGPPFPLAFEAAYGLSRDDALAVTRLYRASFDVSRMEDHELFPGTKALLEALIAAGKTLAIVTGRRLWQVEIMAKGDGILPYFSAVVGQGLEETAPKSELIGRALGELEAQASEAVMVGDRGLDIEGANVHAMPSVGCLFGTATLRELEDAKASVIVRTTAELKAALLGEPIFSSPASQPSM